MHARDLSPLVSDTEAAAAAAPAHGTSSREIRTAGNYELSVTRF